MKALVIYDQVGHIWSITYGGNTAPQGLLHMWVNIPDGAGLERIDVTDENNPQPIFTYLTDNDIEKVQKRVTDLETQLTEAQMALTEQYEQYIALSGEITSTQLALTEIYEGMGV